MRVGIAGSRSEAPNRRTRPSTTPEGTAYALQVCPWLRYYRPKTKHSTFSSVAKRGLDLTVLAVVALPAAVVVMVLMLLVKVGIRDAPPLHSQLRTGQDGRRFRIWKIRTMVAGAEQMKDELRSANYREWPDFKIADDPRVTRLGSVLRRTHLDELPQLWNVANASMSIVGPRPTSFPVEDYEDWHRARLRGKPGLTGLWQVSNGRSSSFDERVMLDLEYLARRSLRLDLAILARTIPHMLKGQGDL